MIIAESLCWSLHTEGTELVLALSSETAPYVVEFAFHDKAAERFPPELEGYTSTKGWRVVKQPNGTVRFELNFRGSWYLIGMGTDNSPDILQDFA